MRSASIVLLLVATTLCVACAHSHSSSTTRTTTTIIQNSPVGVSTNAATAAATQSAAPSPSVATNGAAATDGATVFETNCSSCHQTSGLGLPGTFPPLAHNPVVAGDPSRVIHIVKDGLTGQISVKGVGYNGEMPAWGQALSNSDIAAVITYVRSSWGNAASAVTPAQVAAAK
jgi:mono/diheme cytochrome c family protein